MIEIQTRRRIVSDNILQIDRATLCELLGDKAPPAEAEFAFARGPNNDFALVFQWQAEEAPAAPRKQITGRKHNTFQRPIWDTRSGRAALRALSTGPCTIGDIKLAMKEIEFLESSASPLMSQLIKAGLVSRTGSGSRAIFRLIETKEAEQ